jgi:hypothetical protein
MTMTTSASGEVSISLAGIGTVTIDWGDSSEKETKTLSSDTNIEFTHNYSASNTRTIKIYGKNITDLYCSNNQLTSLDVSKNTEMTYLDCGKNLLTSLDVSNNNVLTNLLCYGNKLTSLNVSNNAILRLLHCGGNQLKSLDVSNAILKELHCSHNQLASLDVSGNTTLEILYCPVNSLTSLDVSNNIVLLSLFCGYNKLSDNALDALFGTLHNHSIEGKGIVINDNPGTATCIPSIAENKGWRVVISN